MDATLIIPTFNRSDVLLQTLRAAARVDYPPERWEIVVVDDGSTDDTQKAVSEWAAAVPFRARCLRQENAGPAAARNRGAGAAEGRHLLFIDNDILVPPDFVRAHLQTLAAHPGCWVVGRIVHPPEIRRTPFGRYRESLDASDHAAPGVAETAGMTAANVSLPADDFARLGGFDTSFTIASGEDWDLGIRARRAGIRIIQDRRIVVVHNDWADTLERFCERQRLYSLSDVRLWRKYGEASPRATLVRANSPVDWNTDPPGLVLKKTAKRLLSLPPAPRLLLGLCRVTERLAPDTRLSRRLYELPAAVAIFRGVRAGLERYAVEPQAPRARPSSA